MAIIATGQISIVDLTDGKSLSCYITSNLPKTQIKDPNPGGSINPDWSGTPKLILTPVIFANQTALALNATGLTITWKRKEGSGGEAALASGESVSGGVLTVSSNKLNSVTSGLLTYEDEARVWQTGVDYIVGDEVAYPDATGDVYVCQQAHTSLSGWEPPAVPALWTQKEQ